MIVSIMFSLHIFRIMGSEIDNMERQRRIRYMQVESDWRIPRVLRSYLLNRLDPEVIAELKKRLAIQLISINGGIFIFASIAGYFLAGRTLKPISLMVTDQKRFIADASHELKTPITSLRSEIEVGLNDKKMTLKDSKLLLASNLEEVIKLQNLIETLLTLSKKEELRVDNNFQSVSLEKVIANALKKLNGSVKKKNIRINAETRNIHVRGLEDKLTELFVILLDNAIKFSFDGTRIDIKIQKNSAFARISLKDQGIGISQSDLKHVFDRFYRADFSRVKINEQGFGLGLSIAKEIVNLHSGSINVKSKLNKGTEFIVKLPL